MPRLRFDYTDKDGNDAYAVYDASDEHSDDHIMATPVDLPVRINSTVLVQLLDAPVEMCQYYWSISLTGLSHSRVNSEIRSANGAVRLCVWYPPKADHARIRLVEVDKKSIRSAPDEPNNKEKKKKKRKAQEDEPEKKRESRAIVIGKIIHRLNAHPSPKVQLTLVEDDLTPPTYVVKDQQIRRYHCLVDAGSPTIKAMIDAHHKYLEIETANFHSLFYRDEQGNAVLMDNKTPLDALTEKEYFLKLHKPIVRYG